MLKNLIASALAVIAGGAQAQATVLSVRLPELTSTISPPKDEFYCDHRAVCEFTIQTHLIYNAEDKVLGCVAAMPYNTLNLKSKNGDVVARYKLKDAPAAELPAGYTVKFDFTSGQPIKFDLPGVIKLLNISFTTSAGWYDMTVPKTSPKSAMLPFHHQPSVRYRVEESATMKFQEGECTGIDPVIFNHDA